MTARTPLPITPRLMTAPVAAAYLGVSESTLRTFAIRRKVLGGKRVYERADLDSFADGLTYEADQSRENTCDQAFG